MNILVVGWISILFLLHVDETFGQQVGGSVVKKTKPCPTGWWILQGTNACLYFSKEKASWIDATMWCGMMGSRLVELSDTRLEFGIQGLLIHQKNTIKPERYHDISYMYLEESDVDLTRPIHSEHHSAISVHYNRPRMFVRRMRNYWIGMSDMQTERVFQWMQSKTLANALRLAPGSNDMAKNCVFWEPKGIWKPEACKAHFQFICEKM